MGAASWRSSKRSGALRFREGRVLGGGVGRLVAAFFAGLRGAAGLDFGLGFALVVAVVFLGGGESSSLSSSRARLAAGLGASFLDILAVVEVGVWASATASVAVTKVESLIAVFSGEVEVIVSGAFGKDGAGGLDPRDVTVSGGVDGGDESGDDEPGNVCAMAGIFVAVLKAFVVCFCGVRDWLSVDGADADCSCCRDESWKREGGLLLRPVRNSILHRLVVEARIVCAAQCFHNRLQCGRQHRGAAIVQVR
jgi:hypothetical protein